jgi:hypothetical protein
MREAQREAAVAREVQKIETEVALQAALARVDDGLYVIPEGLKLFPRGRGTHIIIINKDLKSALLASLSETNCTQLALSWLDIDTDDIERIISALPNLTSLNLTGNKIGDSGAITIARKLPSLKELYLHDNNIGDDGARTIAERLPSLTHLYLWENKIGDDGARAIAEHLTALTSLQLSNNKIGADGAQAKRWSLKSGQRATLGP